MCDAKLKEKKNGRCILTTLNLTPYSNIRYIYAKNVYTRKIELESHNINIIGLCDH